MDARALSDYMRSIASWLIAGAVIGAPLVARAQSTLPSYRARILGVFTTDGDPIEGAEVLDELSKTSALTTMTGTITLSFLAEGATLVRIRKVGFAAATMLVNITPDDTLPVTVMLKRTVRELPKVVTNDSAPRYISPGLQAFEERRKAGGGYFITEKEIRKWDSGALTNVVRQIPGIDVRCARGGGMVSNNCHASTKRSTGKYALSKGAGVSDCPVDVYLDGTLYYSQVDGGGGDNDLQKLAANQFAAIEFYSGGARIPVQYNKTGSSCGVMLLWTRER
jgi:hypothetical protein